MDTSTQTWRGLLLPLLERSEGFFPKPYQDSGGVWTQGLGSTRDAAGSPITASSPPITIETARDWVLQDVQAAKAAVDKYVTPLLAPGQKAALVD